MGVRLRDNLRSIQSAGYTKGLIGDVRGLQLMVEMEFAPEAESGVKNKFCQQAVEEGLLILGCSTYEVLRFIPPECY